jgi:EmrB/QacA subfamily drug resistance transporter
LQTAELSYQSGLPKKQVIAALAGTMLSMLLGSMFQTITATAMPRIITDLGGFSQYTWVFTAYIIAETVSLPLAGKLSDMYGRKWLLVAGMGLFVVGSFLSGLSQSMNQLIIYRVVQGFGFGAMSALGFIVIADLFPPEERGKYSGMMAGVFGLSTVIGPTLGGVITEGLGWRWCFFVMVPVGIIIILIFIFMFPHFRMVKERHRLDYLGVATMALGVVPLILALNWGGVDYAWNSPLIIGLFVFSAIMLTAFVFVERRASEPVIPIALFRNRVVTVSAIVSFLQGAAFFSVITFIPLFFQGVLGADPMESGLFMTPMMLSIAFGSFIGGQLLSRAGGHYRFQTTVGFGLAAVGFFLLAGVTPQTTFVMAAVYISIAGFGNGNIMPIHTIAVQNTVPYAVMGAATSLITLLRPLGGVFGLAIVGSILNNRFASVFFGSLPAEVTNAVPMAELTSIVDNPQALVNPESQDALREVFVGLGPQGDALFETTITTLRESLNSALTQVFMVFLGITLLAMVVNFFLKGVPPYRRKEEIEAVKE